MKLIKSSDKKSILKMSRQEWESIGRDAGWEQSPFLDLEKIEAKARELFVNKGEMEIDNVVNLVLKENPSTTEEAIDDLIKLYNLDKLEIEKGIHVNNMGD